eukprot:CAMPEP_0168331946 /NCGR_PEP_ID=MMETSP0213-20121227/8658_1 /TAXON_ID=151035 /ORGANISM="Euplotes harpa, Strain FSP1.4" /LENGTH=362 /DNA_ID=CAMNT_0008335863 /DNA_START=26 /DNA_END=1114 /DNA_ORIENTATION=-
MSWFGKKKDKHTGFMGDLSGSQQEALDEFRKTIRDSGLTSDTRYDDYYLLRFLRARQFKLDKALKMFKDFLDWRVEYRADEAIVLYKCPNIPEARKLYQHGYHGVDRVGRPFYIDQPCKFDIDELLQVVTKDELYTYYVREYEKLLHIRFPACSALTGTKIEQSFSLLSIEGFTMGKLKEKSREFVKIAISIGRDYYPEIMAKMYIVNAPFLFKGAWAIFKPFIDEKTRDKISIVGSGFQKDLFKYVDPSNVPAELGGKCVCADCEGGCFFSDKGPWHEYPGDEFGEAAKQQLLEEEKKDDPVPVPVPVPAPVVTPVPVPVPMPVPAPDVSSQSAGVPDVPGLGQVTVQMDHMQLGSPPGQQ